MFKGKKCITDISYSPNEHGGDQQESKKAIFDLYCTGDQGEQFIVEMQRGKQTFFRERSVFYTSRLIQDLLPGGEESNTFQLPEVYLIGVLLTSRKKSEMAYENRFEKSHQIYFWTNNNG